MDRQHVWGSEPFVRYMIVAIELHDFRHDFGKQIAWPVTRASDRELNAMEDHLNMSQQFYQVTEVVDDDEEMDITY